MVLADTVNIDLALAVYRDISAIKYVSFDSMMDFWLKILQL